MNFPVRVLPEVPVGVLLDVWKRCRKFLLELPRQFILEFALAGSLLSLRAPPEVYPEISTEAEVSLDIALGPSASRSFSVSCFRICFRRFSKVP